MKILLVACFSFVCWSSYTCPDNFPQTGISNGLVTATLLLPDSIAGYYKGTRFDWSGLVQSLRYKEHSYFGQWFKKYDARRHDAVCGPVEEFEPVGYENAKAGENFIKIGVGALRRKDDKPYSSFMLYEIAQPGSWHVNTAKARVEFIQELKDQGGYAYVYRKTVRLTNGKPEMVLEHSLQNTGSRTLETNVYDHNFFMIDKHPTGPGISIKFPFEVSGQGRGLGTIGEFRGKEIGYLRNMQDNEDMYIGAITGFRDDVSDYDFRIENDSSGAGVRIWADKPLARMVYWACSTTSCPEPYIHIKADPGQTCRWNIRYEFYEKAH